MPRTFGSAFAQVASQQAIRTAFWSLRIDFPEPWELQYFSDRPVTINGNVHEALVTRWGDIASIVDREEKRLDVSAVQIEFTNFPVMSTGERLSDLFTEELETLRAEIFLNLADDDGNVFQERMFSGIVQTPIAYDYERATITIMSLHEAYLNKSALRVATQVDFPAMRVSDVGATIPIAIGAVERSPGRVLKASQKTAPTADPANTSNAKLLDFIANASAVTQDWEITVKGSATVRQVSHDTQTELGLSNVAVTVGNVGTQGVAAGTSLSFAFNNNGNILLAFVVRRSAGAGITQPTGSLTYNGVAMTKRHGVPVEIWYLNNAPTGSNSVSATWSGNHDVLITMFSVVNGVDISTTPRGAQTGPDAGGTASTLSGTDWAGLSRKNGLVLDVLSLGGSFGGSPPTITVGAGQTQRSNAAIGNVRIGVSSRPGAGGDVTPTMSWTISPAIETNQSNHLGIVVYGQPLVASQSFQASGVLQGATLRLRRNNSVTLSLSRVRLAITTDAPGSPSTTVLGETFVDVTAAGDYSFSFPTSITLTGGTTYWLRVLAGTDNNGTGAAFWARNTAGGLASGTAQSGRNRKNDLVSPDILWDGGLSGQDFRFELLLTGTAYEFFGSVTGFDGTGSSESDSVSDSGQITLLASHWQGTPAAGDRFYFSVDTSENVVIFSESPAATPVSAIGTVYWDDVAVVDGSAKSVSTGAVLSSLGHSTGLSAVAAKFDVTVGILVKSVRFFLKKEGAPDQPLSFELRPAQGSVPSEDVLASVEVPASSVTTTAGFVAGIFAESVALLPGTYFAVAATSQSDASNHYSAYNATSFTGGMSASGARKIMTTGVWGVLSSNTHAAEVLVASVSKNASIDDGTGVNVARAGFDVAIPDNVAITADLTGIKDDLSGTYTGTASALIRRPDQVFHWLLRRAGVPTANIDLATTFVDSGALYGGLYLFDGLIQDNETYKKLFLRLAFECRSAFDWPIDKAQLKFLPLRITNADRTVTYANVVAERSKPMISVSRTDTTKIVNFVDVRFDRVARVSRDLTAYKKIVNARNTVSIDRYGQREDPELFFMDFVRSEPMAFEDAEYYANRLSNPRRIVTVSVKYPFLDVEKDDSAAFDLRKVQGV